MSDSHGIVFRMSTGLSKNKQQTNQKTKICCDKYNILDQENMFVIF